MNGEEAALARRACGDIPAAYCHVMGVEITGSHATVWLLTGGPLTFEEYEVEFDRVDGSWRDGAGHGGFQTGTPSDIHRLATQTESRLRDEARRDA